MNVSGIFFSSSFHAFRYVIHVRAQGDGGGGGQDDRGLHFHGNQTVQCSMPSVHALSSSTVGSSAGRHATTKAFICA